MVEKTKIETETEIALKRIAADILIASMQPGGGSSTYSALFYGNDPEASAMKIANAFKVIHEAVKTAN